METSTTNPSTSDTTSTAQPTASTGTSTNTNTNTNTTIDINPILENQLKQYNMMHDYFLFSIALNGFVIALILVNLFAKGFQSNAR